MRDACRVLPNIENEVGLPEPSLVGDLVRYECSPGIRDSCQYATVMLDFVFRLMGHQ